MSAAKWTACKLGSLFQVKHGYAFKGEYFADSGDHVLLTPGNFREEGGLKLKGDREKYYVGDVPEEFLLREGDLLIAMTDLTQNAPILGSPAFVPEDGRFLHNQRLGKVTDLKSELIVPHFLFYLLNTASVRGQIKGSATGSTVRHTSPSRIYDVVVEIPPLATQRRIASILSAYDELIENSQRRIRILESMARALYREWFVHFRFPGHENHPRVASPLGEIPEGWEVRSAPGCVEINPRVTVPREGDKPFVPMGCLSNDSMLITEIETRAGNSGSKFQNGDTLFARITPCLENGKTGYVQFLPNATSVAFGSTEFIVLRSRTLTPEFVYLLARSNEFRGLAIKSMSGATGRQRVQEQCFNDFQIVQPPRALLETFSSIVAPCFRLIFRLHSQIENLRRTRDLLLPRLLSGQIHVEAMPS
jgi:type I restriction enzyme S subunit